MVTSLINTILVEKSQSAEEMLITMVCILNYTRPYPKTVLVPLCPVPGYDVGKIQKLELYDY